MRPGGAVAIIFTVSATPIQGLFALKRRPGRGVAVLEGFRLVDRLEKARPAAAGLELVLARKKRLAADDVHIDAGLVIVPILILKRPLRAVHDADVVGFLVEMFGEFLF